MIELERVNGRSTAMRCTKCKVIVPEKMANKILGIEQTDEGYQTTGDNWKFFYSWYCLKKFPSFEERVKHDKKYHKIGDFMLGCVPSGFSESVPECGNG